MGSLLNGSNDAFRRNIIELEKRTSFEKTVAFGTCLNLLDSFRAGGMQRKDVEVGSASP